MPKRGRPRALNINPVAVEDLRLLACLSKGELAEAAGISTGHLADALYRQKGLSEPAVRRLAGRLGCKPATIAPELSGHFLAIRDGDEAVA